MTDGWPKTPLKHLVSHLNRGVAPDYADEESGLRVLNQACVQPDGRLDVERARWHKPVAAWDSQRGVVAPGDVLVNSTGTGTLGRAALYCRDERVLADGHLTVVRPNPTQLDSRFLAYRLGNAAFFRLANEALYVGATNQTELNREALGAVEVALPSLRTQRAIADFLDAETARIDALVAMKRRVVDLLDERTTVAIETRVLGLNERGAPGVFFGSVPRGWRESVLRHSSVEVQTGPFGSQLQASAYVAKGCPVLNPANLVGGRLIPTPGVSIAGEKYRQMARHHVVTGDVLLGRRGEMGRAALVSDRELGWVCGTGLLRLRSTGRHLLPPYLALLLGSQALREYFSLSSIGSTMDNLGSEQALAAPVLIPPHEKQLAIVDAVLALHSHRESLTEKLERQIELLAEHRQALITAAVTGELAIP